MMKNLIFIFCFLYCHLVSAQVQLGSDIDGEAVNDASGHSVAISNDGKIVAVGSRMNDGNSTNSGHVRVFEFTNGNWSQLGSDLDGESSQDESGNSIALSGDGSIVAIGAYKNDGTYGYDRGHVRVYQYSNGSWSQLGADIDGEGSQDHSGYSISLSDNGFVLAIGAPWNEPVINSGCWGCGEGHVRVYEYSSTTNSWTQRGSDIDGEASSDRSGYAVSLSSNGSIVAVGAPLNDGNGTSSGHVRVYEYSSTTNSWTQLGSDIDGEAVDDLSGSALSLSDDGTIVAIGAEWNDGTNGNSGHVRVYKYTNGNWSQVGNDIDGEAGGDHSGKSVSLNSDGSILAVGAPHNSQSIWSTNYQGHTRIYQFSNGSWSQLGADIDGEAIVDYSGWSVALSDDGTTVSAGAIKNDGNGNNSGHVRVFNTDFGSQLTLSNNGILCLGDTIQASVPLILGTTYLWNTGDTSNEINIYQGGNYDVIISNAFGIVDTVSFSTVVDTVNVTQSGPLTFCSNDSVTLTLSTSQSYLWNTGASTQSINISQAGIYYAIVTTNNGCVDTTTTYTATVLSEPDTSIIISGPMSFCNGDSVSLTAVSGQSYLWNNGDTTQSIVVTSSGNYFVTVTNSNGCSENSAVSYINVHSSPDTSIAVNGDLDFCDGDSVIFNLTSGQSYLWSNNDTNQSITVTQAGSFSAIITTNNGCVDTTRIITTSVNPVPTPEIIAQLNTLCSGQVTTLSTQGIYDSYIWGGDTAGNQDSLIVNSGNYWVTVITAAGCSGSDSISISEIVPYTTQPEVCIVTNDPVSGYNQIIWEKSSKQGTVSYNIYRDGVIGYIKVGSIGVNQLSEFIDSSANPGLQPYKYYVTLMDSCGNEFGNSSTEHSTVHLQSGIGTIGEVNLVWTSYSGASPMYYRIYRKGVWASSFSVLDSVNISNNTYTDFNPPTGNTQYRIGAVMSAECNSSSKTGVKSSLSNSTAQNTVSINEDVIGSIAISPNPNTGYFSITVDQNQIGSVYRIVDNLGRLIDQGIIEELSQDFDLSDKPKGVYRMQVSNYKALKTLSVVIQ